MLATTPEGLSSIPTTYRAGEKLSPYKCPLSSTCMMWHIPMYAQVNKYKEVIRALFFLLTRVVNIDWGRKLKEWKCFFFNRTFPNPMAIDWWVSFKAHFSTSMPHPHILHTGLINTHGEWGHVVHMALQFYSFQLINCGLVHADLPHLQTCLQIFNFLGRSYIFSKIATMKKQYTQT